jgi:hypothetical protein
MRSNLKIFTWCVDAGKIQVNFVGNWHGGEGIRPPVVITGIITEIKSMMIIEKTVGSLCFYPKS